MDALAQGKEGGVYVPCFLQPISFALRLRRPLWAGQIAERNFADPGHMRFRNIDNTQDLDAEDAVTAAGSKKEA